MQASEPGCSLVLHRLMFADFAWRLVKVEELLSSLVSSSTNMQAVIFVDSVKILIDIIFIYNILLPDDMICICTSHY